MGQECISFLQWALPHMEMQWSGFRKVRKQVCKRIQKRMRHLQVPDWKAYRQHLELNKDEWKELDNLCRITISRFYRDYYIYDYISESVFPRLLESFPGVSEFRCISLGCASGEEPYTVAIMWKEKLSINYPDKSLRIIGLDANPVLIQRARRGVYKSSSLRELPKGWKKQAFVRENEVFTLKGEYMDMVEFIKADVRTYKFDGPYHLVCCRNLVATYFSEGLQIEIFRRIRKAMPVGAVLLVGTHELLPTKVGGFRQDNKVELIYWTI